MGGKAIDPKVAFGNMLQAGVKPLVPYTKRRDPWKSQCINCKRVITPSYANVINGHSACKYCAKGGVSTEEAERIMKKAKAKPLTSYPGLKRPWLSKCLLCGREISPRVALVIKNGKACNYCSGRKIDKSKAKKTMRAMGAEPLEEYSGPGRWKCRCKRCKRVIYPVFRKVRKGSNPCGWCARVRIDPEEARKTFSDAGLKPIGKYPGANKPWKAICVNCGKMTERSFRKIADGRYACAFCSGRRISEKEAVSIMKNVGARPLEPFEGIYKGWRSQCLSCFREISPNFSNVRNGHSPCAYCSGKKVDAQSAADFARTRGLKPLEKYPGATRRWKVKCMKCGRTSTTSWTILQLKRRNAGCSSCTEYGFKPLEPAYLYIITHPKKNAHKIGIGNIEAKRIEKHLRNGWKIFRVYEFAKGEMANRVEQSVIEWLRTEKQIGPAFRTGDGWTETTPSESISLRLLGAKVESYRFKMKKLTDLSVFF